MAPNSCVLTIDQGTTRQKVALFAPDGRCLGQQAARNERYTDNLGSYQSADGWWRSASRLTRDLLGQHPVEIAACAVSGRANAGVLLGSAGEVVGDPWLDGRHTPFVTTIRAQYPELSLYGATLLAKLLWRRAHDVRPFTRILYAKDFLVFRLCGEAITDPSSGPDLPGPIAQTGWPTDVLGGLDIDAGYIPKVGNPWDIVGEVSAAASGDLGIPQGTPVVLGAHDGVSANVGAGALTPDVFALTLGTHGVTRCILDRPPPPGARRFYGMPPDRHVVGANALQAGRSLEWFLDLHAPDDANRAALYDDLDGLIAKRAPGAGGVRFFPYLSGQMSPRVRPNLRASFSGIREHHDRTNLYQGVLEGATFAIAEAFAQVCNWCGEPGTVAVTGGGVHSGVWLQLLANTLGRDLTITDTAAEGRGAAIFAALALGWYPGLQDAVDAMTGARQTIEPDARLADTQSVFNAWQAASAALGE